MAEAVQRVTGCPDPRIATAGYHEPSFVFLTRPDTLGAGGGAAAADFLAEGGCRRALVVAGPGRGGRPTEESAFLARLTERGLRAEQLDMVEGRNLNGARLRQMGLWRLAEAPR
jgi:DNA-binding LacI/PurR family transcriptional regulator